MDIIEYLNDKKINFNSQQRQAIKNQNQSVLLLAVPGSGKTTVLVAKIADTILNNKINPDNILTLTFSRESAKDMQLRFENMFAEIINNTPKFSTIHSFCFFILKSYSKIYNRKLPLNIQTQNGKCNRNFLLKSIYKEITNEFLSDDDLEQLIIDISYVKNMMISIKDFDKYKFSTPCFDKVFSEYERYKNKNKFMDFDDMIVYVIKIFEKIPSFLNFYQNKYKYIFLDEAQDTSKLQFNVIKLLQGEHNNTFFVGDEDQSIYSFRGAYPKQLIDFEKEYRDSTVLKMEQNFRSEKLIVEKANQFIKLNDMRYDKNMFCKSKNNGKVSEIKIEDYNKQYEFILNVLKSKDKNQSLAVLYKNNDSGIPLIDIFDKNNVDFYVKSYNSNFLTSYIVKDIICYIRLAYDMKDLEAFSQIAGRMYFSKNMINFVKKHINDYDDIFSILLTFESLPEYIKQQIKDYKINFPRLKNMMPYYAICFIENNLGYGDYISKKDKNFNVLETAYQKLNILKAISKGYKNIFDFLDRLDEIQVIIDDNNQKNSKITLSTIHSSKGLEYDIVILIDLIEGQFPSQKAIDYKLNKDYNLFEEERRLFYVAATRAKSKIIFLTSNKINGEDTYKSRFIKEYLTKN